MGTITVSLKVHLLVLLSNLLLRPAYLTQKGIMEGAVMGLAEINILLRIFLVSANLGILVFPQRAIKLNMTGFQ